MEHQLNEGEIDSNATEISANRQRKTSLFDPVERPKHEVRDKGFFVMTHADYPKGKPRSWTYPGHDSKGELKRGHSVKNNGSS